MCIDEKLSNIKEYLISLRYEGKLSIIDVRFKTGWSVPTSQTIKVEKYPDLPDSYMFYCDVDGIKIDDIADYIAEVIRLNIEREQKTDLLRVKIKELQEFFGVNELSDLKRMKFEIEPEVYPLPTYTEEELPDVDFSEPIATPTTNDVVEVDEEKEDILSPEDKEKIED
jgi:hypothetical protein